jgi:glyoxylase-like metal-dependent hydrolase (beta-lactamase superfamily II)
MISASAKITSAVVDLELQELTDAVFELQLPIPFENGRVNVFIFRDGSELDLLDCGMNSKESLDALRAALAYVGGDGWRLRRLLVTHIHPDHYGAAGVICGELGAELYMHRLEVPMVHPRYLELEQLVEEVGRHLQVNGVPEPEAEVQRNASRAMRDFVVPAAVAAELDGAESLVMGRCDVRIEWTPGHSPGHICVFVPTDRLLFAGDQLLPDISPNIGLHPQSTPNPLDDFLSSLNRLIALDPAQVFPAHGRPFNDAAGRAEYLQSHHRRRKDQMLEIVDGRELTAWEVALEVWGERRHVYEKRLALQEGLAHLQSLALEGKLEKRVTTERVTWSRPRP